MADVSLDPTVSPIRLRSGMKSLDSLIAAKGEVYAFDFDGVLASPFEDAVYKMPPSSEEVALIERAATSIGIRCAGMELRYQRHLVYQAALWRLAEPIAPGPALSTAKDANKKGAPIFVVSARSSWFAVDRMRHFLELHRIIPLEIFNVGRVTKEKQIELLAKEFPGKTINFVEDSTTHLEQIAKLTLANVRLVLIRSEPGMLETSSLRIHFAKVLETAIFNQLPPRALQHEQ